jgi:hypothetical protein
VLRAGGGWETERVVDRVRGSGVRGGARVLEAPSLSMEISASTAPGFNRFTRCAEPGRGDAPATHLRKRPVSWDFPAMGPGCSGSRPLLARPGRDAR